MPRKITEPSKRELAKIRRKEQEPEIYGVRGSDKTPQQCYNWWRRKHLCILRGVEVKDNYGFDSNITKAEKLEWTSKMLGLIKKDL